jgi:glycosyltransferase involved in cell wall biosynthesis
MTMAPRVSVVMGVFNGAQYLRDSIQSILDQEGVDLELIIVNDGSNGETREILARFAAEDSRVHVLDQCRSGLTMALTRGCEAAVGEYIARQDNGDVSLPGRLRTQMEVLDGDQDLAFASCWTEFCGPDGEFLYCGKGTGVAITPRNIISEEARNGLADGPTCHPSVMMRRRTYLNVGGYRPQFYFGQDWDLWYRLAEAGSFQMVGHVLYRARVTPDSLSGRYKALQERIAGLSYHAMLRRRQGQPEDDLLQLALKVRPPVVAPISARSMARGLYFIGEQLRRNGDERAEGYFRNSLRSSPTSVKSWLRLLQVHLKRMR